MPTRLLVTLVLLAICLALESGSQAKKSARYLHILFVGNSLTYVGNLPATLEGLSRVNRKPVVAEMLVQGGATLTQRLDDGSVETMLGADRFDYVVLQERGGDILCEADDETAMRDCDSWRAHRMLADLARAHGAQPILLGTYQSVPEVSRAIEASERTLAARIGAVHIPVSERIRGAVSANPDMNWFHKDGAHPGHDLVLLEAIAIYRAIRHVTPAAHAFSIPQTLLGPRAHFIGAPPQHPEETGSRRRVYEYEEAQVAKIIAVEGPAT